MARSDALSCPFQVDACIAYNDTKMSAKTMAKIIDEPDDPDSDGSSDDESDQKAFEFEDCVFSNFGHILSVFLLILDHMFS